MTKSHSIAYMIAICFLIATFTLETTNDIDMALKSLFLTLLAIPVAVISYEFF